MGKKFIISQDGLYVRTDGETMLFMTKHMTVEELAAPVIARGLKVEYCTLKDKRLRESMRSGWVIALIDDSNPAVTIFTLS